MTNYEKIKSMSFDELASWLCEMQDQHSYNCAECFADKYCHFGHNGMKDWLNAEVEDDD